MGFFDGGFAGGGGSGGGGGDGGDPNSIIRKGAVANYAALPDATISSNWVYYCTASQGVWPFNYKPAGLYMSNGSSWIPYENDSIADQEMNSHLSTYNHANIPSTIGNISNGSSKISVTGGTGATVNAGTSIDIVESNLTISNMGGTLAIGNGGTGKTTSIEALNALLPNQDNNAGKILLTDGNNASWQPFAIPTIKVGVETIPFGNYVDKDAAHYFEAVLVIPNCEFTADHILSMNFDSARNSDVEDFLLGIYDDSTGALMGSGATTVTSLTPTNTLHNLVLSPYNANNLRILQSHKYWLAYCRPQNGYFSIPYASGSIDYNNYYYFFGTNTSLPTNLSGVTGKANAYQRSWIKVTGQV